MPGRHELKHYINESDYAQLRARLRVVAKPDTHAGSDGFYRVRSLYFDNYSDKAVIEKLAGLSRREKFRLRYYNGDTAYIKLERKSKANRVVYKESALITAEQCAALLSGDYMRLREQDSPLCTGFYSKIRTQNLRARNIVDYDRQAYTYPAGNVRITFDTHIRTTNNTHAFLKPGTAPIPAAAGIIMEIKYDAFLPDIIRDIIKIDSRNGTEFSKYVAARLV